MFAIVATAALLAGCQDTAEPADPPSDEEMGTSDAAPTTADAAPETQAPPDDVQQTSEAPEQAAPEPDGPPEMPEVAREDSEAGAEAFALHYVDLINYTGKYPEIGILEPLSADSCESCTNHEDSVSYSAKHHETLRGNIFAISDSVALHDPTNSVADVRLQVTQLSQDVLDADGNVVDTIEEKDATMVLGLTWDQEW